MDLQTFIKETLIQISNGMIEAQEALKEKGAKINPPHMKKDGDDYYVAAMHKSATEHAFQTIDFDIAITVQEADKAEGGFSVSVFAAKIGLQGKEENEKTNMSRVKFQIVAHLPQYTVEDM